MEEPGFSLVEEEGELEDQTQPSSGEEEPRLGGFSGPSFHRDSLFLVLRGSQHTVNPGLTDSWGNSWDFLWKRYGVKIDAEQEAHGLEQNFHLKLGHSKDFNDVRAVELFTSFASQEPPPSFCDLSTNYKCVGGGFPSRSSGSILSICRFQDAYLVTINGGEDWKLLIEDPLAVLQIEREGWDLERNGLISKLVAKGLPFKLLYPSCQRGAVFYPNPGPELHPAGKAPSHGDYLAYRLDVAGLFRHSPHTYAAALCAGGISWRIALDVLPFPDEHQIARPFHPLACEKYTVDGRSYWAPKLTEAEEKEIAGVYMWAGEASLKTCSRRTAYGLQNPSRARRTTAGGPGP